MVQKSPEQVHQDNLAPLEFKTLVMLSVVVQGDRTRQDVALEHQSCQGRMHSVA